MRKIFTFLIFLLCCLEGNINTLLAQELNFKVNINHQQIQQTSDQVFDDLKKAITEFLNTQQWTNAKYLPKERINGSLNLTINQYDATSGEFVASAQIQVNRPVYNSTYTTPIFAFKDPNFNFTFRSLEPLTFKADQIDDNLTALLAFYAYLSIGIDSDAMALKAGTHVLQLAQNLVSNAQSLPAKGWKAFENSANRFALINDYLDVNFQDFRTLQYIYHRKGLDEMANNSERGRNAVYEAILLLQKSKEAKPMSHWPQLFTEYKADELVNIFAQKGTNKEREQVHNILMQINASFSNTWSKIQ